MTCMAGCPVVSLPLKHWNWSLSVSMSIAIVKRAHFFRRFTSSLSGTSFPAAALAAPLPLLALGTMATEKKQGIERQWKRNGGKRGRGALVQIWGRRAEWRLQDWEKQRE